VPDGWALKSVRSGGRDPSRSFPTDFAQSRNARLDLVVTDRVAQPSVRVADDRGTPLATFQVVTIPADPSRWRLGLQVAPGTPSPAESSNSARSWRETISWRQLRWKISRHSCATPPVSAISARIATPITLTQGDTRTIDLTLARLPDRR
jgi:hypothetical protein